MNDPPTSSGWYCAQEGADQLYQGFVPTRRLLSAFEIRIFKRFNFPASGMTLAGRVHIGTGTGAVVGTATATVPPGGPDELLVHFDFSPAAVLEPQGTFVFELAQPSQASAGWVATTTRTRRRRRSTAMRLDRRRNDRLQLRQLHAA